MNSTNANAAMNERNNEGSMAGGAPAPTSSIETTNTEDVEMENNNSGEEHTTNEENTVNHSNVDEAALGFVEVVEDSGTQDTRSRNSRITYHTFFSVRCPALFPTLTVEYSIEISTDLSAVIFRHKNLHYLLKFYPNDKGCYFNYNV